MAAVTVERVGAAGRVALVTLNRPKSLNALNLDVAAAWKDALAELEMGRGGDLGAVVVTGAGRAFSAGGDLKFLHDRRKDTPPRNAVVMRRFYARFLDPMLRLPVPTISAINGPAIGAGCALATAADIRLIGKSARIGFTFVQLGLSPGMGSTHFLPAAVGSSAAARLLLTGDVVDAEEAGRIGFAEVVDDDALLDEAVALGDRISQQAPLAVRATTKMLRMRALEGMDDALWREASAQATVYGSNDMAEGLAALVEKRRPQFSDFEELDG